MFLEDVLPFVLLTMMMNGEQVLKSGPKDKVFINFVDHGGAGIIEFPNGDFLHAKDLNTALQLMHTKKMYEKLVFYMEACESGSMFEGLLPTDINIYATTAANAKESSWGPFVSCRVIQCGFGSGLCYCCYLLLLMMMMKMKMLSLLAAKWLWCRLCCVVVC